MYQLFLSFNKCHTFIKLKVCNFYFCILRVFWLVLFGTHFIYLVENVGKINKFISFCKKTHKMVYMLFINSIGIILVSETSHRPNLQGKIQRLAKLSVFWSLVKICKAKNVLCLEHRGKFKNYDKITIFVQFHMEFRSNLRGKI